MGGRISGVRTRVRTRRVVTIAAPAAGSDASLTVPGGHLYRVLSVYGVLTTDANVADRAIEVRATIDGSVVGRFPTAGTVPANSTAAATWAPHLDASAGTAALVGSIPELPLTAGAVLATLTTGIQAGDQWSAVNVLVLDEWIHRGPIALDRLDLEVIGVIEPGD